MSLSQPVLMIVAAVAGLLLGAIVVYVAPRLVAYRLEEPPAVAPALTLVPIAGIWITRWHVRSSLVTEVGCAGLFVGLAAHYGSSPRLLLAAAYTVLLLAVAYIDLEHRLVLNRLSFPGIVLCLALAALWPGLGIPSSALGAVTGLIVFGALQIVGRGALGTGDTKLAILIGAMRGVPGVLNALLLGVVLGGIGAAFFLFVLRRGRRDYMAYAPYLSAGAVLSFFLAGP